MTKLIDWLDSKPAQVIKRRLEEAGLNVTIQTIYNWKKGKGPNPEHFQFIKKAANGRLSDCDFFDKISFFKGV